MRKYKNKIAAAAAVIAVLVLVYWWGGDAPGMRGWVPAADSTAVVQPTDTTADGSDIPAKIPQQPDEQAPSERPEDSGRQADLPKEQAKPDTEAIAEQKKHDNVDADAALEKEQTAQRISGGNGANSTGGDVEYSRSNGMDIDSATGKDKYQTAPVPAGKPVPVEPENAVISDKQLTCTLSIRCDTILDNLGWLDKEKIGLVPENGIIFAEKTVTFYEGESVFNVLLREMKRNSIHMEFENTPIYNSAYIEGIGNLYEFDCGELSGWMYKVNGWFPNYGCSRYQLKAGDKVEWVYTCDLGTDVGGNYSTRNGK